MKANNYQRASQRVGETLWGAGWPRINAKNRYSKIVPMSRPFPMNLSIALRRNCVKRTKMIIRSENIKGIRSCLSIYLVSSRMLKITT